MRSGALLSDIVDEVWARHGDREAVREADLRLTYRNLLRWSERISRVLESVLPSPGHRVALRLPNSAAFVASFFGITRAGGVAAPLSTELRAPEIARYLGDLDTAAIVTAPALMDEVVDAMPRLGREVTVIEVAPEDRVRLVRRGLEETRSVVASDGSPPALQQATSGSTGLPKQIVRTHQALLLELEALREIFEISERDKFLGAAPFAHVNGLVRTMMTSMYVGGTLYPVHEFRRREILDLLTSERVTFFGGVPRMFVILAETPLRGTVNLSSLRVLFSSSAPLLSADNTRFHARYGLFIRQLYGSTETGTISFNRDLDPARGLETVGTPIPGVSVEVLDEQGRLTEGEGEFAIVSPFAAAGYLDTPSAAAESFRNGAYLSGDLGRKDGAGVLTITGRRKLLINRGGLKVNPYEVEAAIKEHPKVIEAAVFGVPSPHGDDVISCVIVSSEVCTSEEILLHCRERIADFKIPARIEFRPSLPMSPTGKVLRLALTAEAKLASLLSTRSSPSPHTRS